MKFEEDGVWGNPAKHRTSIAPPGLEKLFRPTVKPSNNQTVNTLRNPIHGGIDFGWGVPCPLSRD